MKVLVVGGGAREHAIVWKLAQSPKVKEIIVAPGNAGTAKLASNLDIGATAIDSLLKAATDNHVDLTFVGPEGPLAEGIVDKFLAARQPIFGPTRTAAEIESSKIFSKRLCHKHRLPCAASTGFSDFSRASEYVAKLTPPIVVKADGLAAGKGVVIAQSVDEAREALEHFMKKRSLGHAGTKVIIEECLSGREMSFFAFTDGHAVVPMVPACDYKRVFDGDRGPNTGGMGSYSPPSFYTPSLATTVMETIMVPAVKAMREEGRKYKGVLYGGLMIKDSQPKVLEFNARFGDPETQVVLPRLKTDLMDIMLAVVDNKLEGMDIEWKEEACVGVVMASGGYPENYKTGFPVTGLDDLDKDVVVFHAGTKVGPAGEVLTCGGRVLTVVASGKTVAEAREKVYANVTRIQFQGAHFRKDIAAGI